MSRIPARATTRFAALSLVTTTLVTATLVTACGGGGTDGSGGGKTTVSVGLFGTFGYAEAGLFDEYMKQHPNITIKYSATEKEENYWSALQTKLAAGGGLADVQGFEVGRSVEVTRGAPAKWTDLRTFGADAVKDSFYPFTWSGGTTADGKVLGLGTDTGPMAMCYRKDLLAAAGLPTDRTQLAAAWPTWDAYLALGERFTAKAPKGSAWVDSAGSVYSASLGQHTDRYYDASGALVHETSPAVRTSWNLAMATVGKSLSARLGQFTPPWNQAFSTGSFATIACPAWMLGYIKGQAGDKAAGRWDVAAMPGGGGNWGGSYLGVPASSKHQKEAAELVRWLTAPEQQVTLFVKQGSFPSSPQAAADPKVASNTNAYFSNAPVGELFAASAKALGPQTHGLKERVVDNAITSTGIVQVEQQGRTPEQGWAAAVQAAKKAVGR
ncbi:MAG: cellobiose transport system substrate-binding protein [Actinomycetota bacterium]|nr:cellobiose transport system substrate-binding protein [Actinomycetota bacterium]